MKRINKNWNQAGPGFSSLWSGSRWSMLRKRGPQRGPLLDQLQPPAEQQLSAGAPMVETTNSAIEEPPSELPKARAEALCVRQDDDRNISLSMQPRPGKAKRIL
jgi:hypothetical protein